MEIEEKLAELNKLREEAKAGGGPKRIEAQHAKGKLTARKGSLFSLIPEPSRKSTPLLSIVAPTSEWRRHAFLAIRWLLVMARSTTDLPLPFLRISLFLVARCQR